jgi:hypothetical protein
VFNFTLCTTPDHRRALQLKSLSRKGHAAPAQDSNKSAEIASEPIARHPGFIWYSDPREQLTGILLTQRMMDSPKPPRAFVDFWTSAYQAIDD